jgi:hypothetical protein
MNETEVNYLKSCLAAGLLVWWRGGNGWLLVTAVTDSRKGVNKEDSEPGPVAYLEDGYLALDATDQNDLMVTTPNLWKRGADEDHPHRTTG